MIEEPDRFLTAEVGGETFLLDQGTGRYYRLGGVGGVLWELLKSGRSVQEAAETVAERTGAPLDVVAADAAAFIKELIEAGVLEPEPEPPQEPEAVP